MHPWRDLINLCSLVKPNPWLSARSINTNGNNVSISSLYKRIQRHIIDYAAVQVGLTMERFILKSEEAGARQQKICQKSFRNFIEGKIKLLHIRKRKSQQRKINSCTPDPVLVQNIVNQILKRSHINTAVPQPKHQLF